MTDLYQPEGGDDREAARRTATAHTDASRDVEAFLRRMPAVVAPADIAEYGALLAREELVRAQRRAAVEAAGLSVPSIESE